MWKAEDTFDKVFRHCVTTEPAPDPKDPNVPVWTPICKALDEVVKVDITIPGCPPHPDWIADALTALLEGKTAWALPERSVCDTCPVIREQKSGGGPIKRGHDQPRLQPRRRPGEDALHQRAGLLLHGTGDPGGLRRQDRGAPVRSGPDSVPGLFRPHPQGGPAHGGHDGRPDLGGPGSQNLDRPAGHHEPLHRRSWFPDAAPGAAGKIRGNNYGKSHQYSTGNPDRRPRQGGHHAG